MFRAIVQRNCRPAWMGGYFRGMKSNSCQSPWNHVSRNKCNSLWGWNRYQRPFRSFDDHFQSMMGELERNMAFISGRHTRYQQEAKVWCNNKEFEVNIDISHFKPENINVKVTKDKLIISGKHEQKEDEHGSVSREFTREVIIPENVDIDSMTSLVTEEGLLVIRAKVKGTDSEDKTIKINIERDT